MSQFPFSGRTLSTADPFKRVKYALGLVLGVDEFEQEQGYFRQRLDWHQLLMHGAGTVYGLGVEVKGQHVVVQPGLAVDSLGRLIRVSPAQWANLSEWLTVEANRQMLLSQPAAAGDLRSLYIVLRHAEEGTDPVAFPGSPERPHEQAMLPTRVVEAFALDFAPRRPEAAGSKAARLLSDLLNRLEIVEKGPVDERVIAAEVRALRTGSSSGLQRRVLAVSRENLEAVLTAALRTWLTDVLPALRPGLEQGPPDDAGVLLARLELKVSETGQLLSAMIDEAERPFVLPALLAQELLVRRMPAAGAGASRVKSAPRTERALAALDSVMQEAGAPPVTAPAETAAAAVEPFRAETAARVRPFVSVTRDWTRPEPTLQMKFHLPPLQEQPFTVTVHSVVDTMGFGFIRNRPVTMRECTMVGENLFTLVLDERAAGGDHFQLEFDLRTMQTRNGPSLAEMAQRGDANWLGYDGAHTLTAFCDDLRPVTSVVAAGIFRTDGTAQGRNLRADPEKDGICRLRFKGYTRDAIYIVKATPLAGLSARTPSLVILSGRDEQGILARISYPENWEGTAEFMVEISCVNVDESR